MGFTEKFEDSFEYEVAIYFTGGFKMVLMVIKTFGWRARVRDDEGSIYIRLPDEVKSNKFWHLKKTVYGRKGYILGVFLIFSKKISFSDFGLILF